MELLDCWRSLTFWDYGPAGDNWSAREIGDFTLSWEDGPSRNDIPAGDDGPAI